MHLEGGHKTLDYTIMHPNPKHVQHPGSEQSIPNDCTYTPLTSGELDAA